MKCGRTLGNDIHRMRVGNNHEQMAFHNMLDFLCIGSRSREAVASSTGEPLSHMYPWIGGGPALCCTSTGQLEIRFGVCLHVCAGHVGMDFAFCSRQHRCSALAFRSYLDRKTV